MSERGEAEYQPEPEEWYEAPPLAEASQDSPIAIYSPRARWRNEAATRAAHLLQTHPAVFHDEGDALVWVKDQRRALITLVGTDEAAGLFTEINVEFREQKGKLSAEVPAPDQLLRRVVTGRFPECKWRLLRGLAEGPYIMPDASIVTEAGYFDDTALWLPSGATIDLPAGKAKGHIAPHGYNQRTAAEGIDWLMDQLDEFPWHEDVDRSIWLAYLFTLITRPAYDRAPFFLYDAPHSGSGKNLLIKCASLIAHGREPRGTTFIGDKYQDENRVATMINDGYATIVIDDIRVLDNTLLISLITEGNNYSIRGLGGQQSIRIPYNLTIAGTGHNVRFKEPDMIRRTLRCRLTPDIPHPEDRPKTKLTEIQLRQFFLDHRQRCLSIVLNTLRGYLRDAKHHPDDIPKGLDCSGFAAWASIVQGAVLWLGRPDPMISQIRLREAIKVRAADPVDTLIHAWWKHWGPAERKAGQILDLATGDPSNLTSSAYHVRDALQGLTDKPLKPRVFLNLMTAKDDQVYEVEDSTGTKLRIRLHVYDKDGSNTYQLRPVDSLRGAPK